MRNLTRTLFALTAIVLSSILSALAKAPTSIPVLIEPNFSQNGSGWIRIAPEGEEFAALVPAQQLDIYTDQSLLIVEGATSSSRGVHTFLNVYSAYSDRAVFLIHAHNTLNPREMMNNMLRSLNRRLDRSQTHLTERDITLDRVRGKHITIERNNYFIERQYFPVGERLYIAETAARATDNPAVRRFWSAFRLREGRRAVEAETVTAPGVTVTAAPPPPIPGSSERPNLNRIYSAEEVSARAVIIWRPAVTESRRTTGRIVIRAVLSSSGQVTDIVPLETVPGLTEQAIAAVRRSRFLPAEIEGRPVSQYAQFIYNFEGR